MSVVTNRAWSIALVVGLVMPALAGCAVFGSGPTRIEAEVQTSNDLNPDYEGRPSPLVVRMYQLKTPIAFKNATFFALYDKEEAELGNDLQGREEFELRPGQKLTIERELKAETRFIGILAGYRNIEGATWRTVTPVAAEKNNKLKIDFKRLGVSTVLLD